MKALRRLFIASVLLLSFGAMVRAREFQVRSYQTLLDKSDLVIIAAPIATSDTKEEKDLPTVGAVVGVETRLQISAVLKGDKTLKQLVFHHYRAADTRPKKNAPALVAFDSAHNSVFLFFLVREADGRYAPTSGQSDPGNFDVRCLGEDFKAFLKNESR